jgi:hypothetical protein
MIALLVRVEHYARRIIGFFIAFEALQLCLAILGVLFIAEHFAGWCGYSMTLRSPIALHAIQQAQTMVRR